MDDSHPPLIDNEDFTEFFDKEKDLCGAEIVFPIDAKFITFFQKFKELQGHELTNTKLFVKWPAGETVPNDATAFPCSDWDADLVPCVVDTWYDCAWELAGRPNKQ
eukprot:TRINITY_DN52991_c0_g1_i2.p2 TRINITY_DN52991_c0_g1~~TRINITY_DN52991_c0_g1_i2.p2  ORF type:complete len:106 (+),score=18.11 TRINITY_DN52991_c0_g1_i2:249-566(+)